MTLTLRSSKRANSLFWYVLVAAVSFDGSIRFYCQLISQLNIICFFFVNRWKGFKDSAYSLNEQSKWTLAWLLMPDGLICVFLKLLISWDFDEQWCLKFTQNGKKREKRYFLLMREVREWPTGAFCECWACSVCVRLFCSCYSLYFIDSAGRTLNFYHVTQS